MGELHRSAAMLGFYGDDLDPVEITAGLGAQPTVGIRKGASWVTPSGREKIAPTGSWRLKAGDREPADLDGQINELLDGLSNDLAVWRSLAARFGGRFFCGIFLDSFNEGFDLRPGTLSRLSERGLMIDFDIYGESSEV
ncbi:DUF4279 domain-containing protein [Sphingobium yanoikuyae]